MGQIAKPLTPDSANSAPIARRAFLEAGVGAAFATAAVGSGSVALPVTANATADPAAANRSPRQLAVFQIRQSAAQAYLDESMPVHTSNGDEAGYADKRASFCKTLPHNDVGEVDVEAFKTFVTVLRSGDASSFETIPRDPAAEVALNDPQATYALDLAGLDGAATALDPPSGFFQPTPGNRDGGDLLASVD